MHANHTNHPPRPREVFHEIRATLLVMLSVATAIGLALTVAGV